MAKQTSGGAMDDWLVDESASLVNAWGYKTKEELRVYLVRGFQDPRISIQKILMRHFFAQVLWPGQLKDLILAELKHAIRLNLRLAAGFPLSEVELSRFGKVWNSALR